MYPMSFIREFCISKNHLEAITQLLLMEDKKLRCTIIKFIKSYFIPDLGRLKYPKEKVKPLVDILIKTLNKETGEEALGLLYNIQRVFNDYNSDLDLSVFSLADRQLINTNDRIKNSIFLRYVTVPFVKRITENSSKSDILSTFMIENIIQSTLIWTKEMRELLQNTLDEHLKSFQTLLKDFVKTKTPNYRTTHNMPIYSDPFTKVINYPQVKDEIRCIEYYLRIWNTNKEKLENDAKTRFFNNLPNTFKEITDSFPNVNLDNCQVVIKSYSISYAVNSDSNERLMFPHFDMMIKIVEEICKSILVGNNQYHMKKIFKFIYRTVLLNFLILDSY